MTFTINGITYTHTFAEGETANWYTWCQKTNAYTCADLTSYVYVKNSSSYITGVTGATLILDNGVYSLTSPYSFTMTMPEGFKSGGNFPLVQAQDVLMTDGTRLDTFKPLPDVTESNNGQVLKVINGAWGVGLTIQAEVDSAKPTQLNIF